MLRLLLLRYAPLIFILITIAILVGAVWYWHKERQKYRAKLKRDWLPPKPKNDFMTDDDHRQAHERLSVVDRTVDTGEKTTAPDGARLSIVEEEEEPLRYDELVQLQQANGETVTEVVSYIPYNDPETMDLHGTFFTKDTKFTTDLSGVEVKHTDDGVEIRMDADALPPEVVDAIMRGENVGLSHSSGVSTAKLSEIGVGYYYVALEEVEDDELVQQYETYLDYLTEKAVKETKHIDEMANLERDYKKRVYHAEQTKISDDSEYDMRMRDMQRDFADRKQDIIFEHQKDMVEIQDGLDMATSTYEDVRSKASHEKLTVDNITKMLVTHLDMYGNDLDELVWYCSHDVMKRFCAINNISRRQSHHVGMWAYRHYADTDKIANREWLAERGFDVQRNDDIMLEWITNADGQGASSYPVNMLGVDVMYTDIQTNDAIIDRDMDSIKIILAQKDGRYNDKSGRTHRRAVCLMSKGDIRMVDLVRTPTPVDQDGNKNHEGKRYKPVYAKNPKNTTGKR